MKTLSTQEIESGYATLRTQLEMGGPISDATWQYVTMDSRPVFYKKKSTMIREGELPTITGYITKMGAAKSYYISPIDGRQVVTGLYLTGDICGPVNFQLGEPSQENIEFVEDSWLLCSSYTSIKDLNANFQDFARVYALLLDYRTRTLQEKVRDLQMLTARQRLEKLMAVSPHYFKHFSIADIASYLGTERETLTRLRSKLLR